MLCTQSALYANSDQRLCLSLPLTGMPVLAQGMMVAEVIMDHLGRTVGKSAAEIRSLNMYKEGETTHFGQALDGCQVTHPCKTLSSEGTS